MITRTPFRRLFGLPVALARGFDGFVGLVERIIFPFGTGARRESDEAGERRESMRAEVWRLRHLLHSALSTGVAEDLAAVLRSLGRNAGNFERAFVAWVDLIELLVQDAEKRHGGRPGLGKIKTNEVKEVLRHLMRSGKFSLPNIPPALQPVVFDVVLDWVIDVVVLQVNRYDLWEPLDERPGVGRRWLHLLLDWVKKIFLAIANAVGGFFGRLWERMRPLKPLSPELREALAAVEREGMLAGEEGIMVTISRLLIWVGTHRDSLVKSSELIFEAVQEAEDFFSLTGPQKKQYARDLIWTVLEEMGFAPRSALLTALADSLIDVAIESSVHLFHKRGLFLPHGEERALPA